VTKRRRIPVRPSGEPRPAEQPDEAAAPDNAPPPEDRAVEELVETGDEALRAVEEGESAEPDHAAQIEQLRAHWEDAKNKALRYQADLDNYRKRVARQMEEERRYANLPLIRDLLPVWDNMHRAVEAAEQNHQTASLLEGFKMVTRQLEDVLARHDCTPIEAEGEPFDPHRHEAVLQQPTGDHPPNTVVQVTQTGFQLHDRVVRPSQVIVAAAVPEEAPHVGEEESEGTDAGQE
jgi:molecular chaperone GrpE